MPTPSESHANESHTKETLRLRRILDRAPDAVVAMDRAGLITSWNQRAETMFGWSQAEALGRGVLDTIIPARLRAGHDRAFEELQSAGEGPTPALCIEITALRRNGQEFPAELAVSPLQLGDDWAFSAFIRDITDRKQAQQGLRLSHDQLERRVQERTEELQKAKETAEAATRAKSQFLANMSHEIRTPLNGVIGMTSLLLAHDLGAEEREFADTIRLSGEALLTVVNDILDFSKIEAGKFQLDVVEFKPQTVLEEAIELIAVTAHRKDLELTLEIDPGLPAHVSGDPARLRQIVLNLLSNAVKFTAQGEVRLRGRQQARDGDEVELYFEVSDSGIGIARDTQERLFESFVQADSSTTRKYGGTGLGLAISKQLVQRMGGRIGVTSVPGEGSLFWFTVRVPLISKAAGSPEQHANMHGCRVLVVDDNDTNRRILKGQLKQWRIETETSEDGLSALRALLSAYQSGRPFDLVILDFMMPVMDGLMLTEAIRSQTVLADLPIILLTSAAVPAVISRAKELRVTGCLTKPAREAHLLRVVRRALVGGSDDTYPAHDGLTSASSLDALHRNVESATELSQT